MTRVKCPGCKKRASALGTCERGVEQHCRNCCPNPCRYDWTPIKHKKDPVEKKRVMKKLGSGNIWFGKLDGQPVGYYRVSLSDKAGNPKRLNISNLGAWVRVRLWAEVIE